MRRPRSHHSPTERWSAYAVLLILALSGVGANAQSPPEVDWVWHTLADDGCISSFEWPTFHVAPDPFGDVFVGGTFIGTFGFAFDDTVLTTVDPFDYDAFFAKYDGAGNPLWIRQAASISAVQRCDRAASVTTDPSGNGIFVGQIHSTTVFDTTTVVPTGTSDAFIVKFDGAGNLQWVETIGVASSDAAALGVAADASGNVFVTGFTEGSAFLSKYNPAGSQLWYWQSSLPGRGYDVSVDPQGNCLLTGFGNFTLPDTTLTGFKIAVAKCDPAGNFLWAFQDADNSLNPRKIVTDSGGNFYLTGEFYFSTTVGDSTFTSLGLFLNGFIARYDGSGAFLWARGLLAAGVSDDVLMGGAGLTPTDGCLVSGGFVGKIQVGDAPADTISTPVRGQADPFVVSYDSNGDVSWAIGVSSGVFDRAFSVGADPFGDVIFTGVVADSAWFGDTLVVGAPDFFLAKYSLGTISAVEDGATPVPAGAVSPNYPNPFNPSTTIPFRLTQAGHVQLEIFDVAGRRIRVLVNDALGAGVHRATWDGRNRHGEAVASGVYFVRLQAAERTATRKIVLLN